MYEVADTTQFQNLLSNNELVFVKFTAEWCKPCKEIQPFFHEIGAKYANTGDKKIAFTTVDVDELDEIASKYNVAMMPTFVAIRNGVDVFDTMSGSNEGRLETFVKNAVESWGWFAKAIVIFEYEDNFLPWSNLIEESKAWSMNK